ncbi:MAG: hypothetical protein HC837_01250 [Chloroflexaceae bacterium]|nr:hypothetical protein [Chloroflexaceae bacterium]
MNKYIALLLVLLFLVACGDTIDPEQELPSVGGSSPESVAESFFEDLNDALKDANLSSRRYDSDGPIDSRAISHRVSALISVLPSRWDSGPLIISLIRSPMINV